MWTTVGLSLWKNGWREAWTTCLYLSYLDWRWHNTLLMPHTTFYFPYSITCFVVVTVNMVSLFFSVILFKNLFAFLSPCHRWQRGMGSIFGGWSTLTSRPIVVCVRACCLASGSRDSAAPVRGHSRHLGAVMHHVYTVLMKCSTF